PVGHGRSHTRAGGARPRSVVAAHPAMAVRRIPGRRCRHAFRCHRKDHQHTRDRVASRLVEAQRPRARAAGRRAARSVPRAGPAPGAQNAAAKWLAWYRANVSPLAAATPDSWIPERLEYRFAIRAGSGDRQLVFNAPLHDGGTIDWYTFDHNPGAKLALAAEG